MFLPTTKNECKCLGWDILDVVLITGDTYIDSPFIGAAVIGKVLVNAGYRVGIIAQPDTQNSSDITRLGEPVLFWGITGGCMDSMVANYTATRKFRNRDDLTPGEKNNLRPDRAVIVYANLIRRWFKNTVPLVLGGIEASLRRIAHYDYWTDSVRNSVLFDAKADILVYGMGEKTALFLADCLKEKKDYKHLKGICYIAKNPVTGYISLPPAQSVKEDKKTFLKMFTLFYKSATTRENIGLVQQHGDRYLIHNPQQDIETINELDNIYSLPYEYDAHPYYRKKGEIRSLDTIRFSITTHRGCCGECSFCAISLHQGTVVRSRSVHSIIEQLKKISKIKGFKGYITDVGGATANMYALRCRQQGHTGMCENKTCLYPEVCRNLLFSHKQQLSLLKKLRSIPGIKKIFIASGIRHDMIVADSKSGKSYLQNILAHHTSGQIKIAPEHTSNHICSLMGKPGSEILLCFKKIFDQEQTGIKNKQFLTYYFIAAHPGCTVDDMRSLYRFIKKHLKINPEQVQIFTPTPSTWSTAMYYTGINPFTGESVFVEKDPGKKKKQKEILTGRNSGGKKAGGSKKKHR